LIDACTPLTEEQLASPVPGTYGSILDMMRHIVGADARYLFVITGGRTPNIDEESMQLPELRAVMERHQAAWSSLLTEGLEPGSGAVVGFDPGAVVVAHRADGSERHAPYGIRLAQALHHGTDHRSQICTGLTALGMEPPDIDVWAFGEQDGRVFDVPPV
jgi:uncharacterized damage-inducible protein DinB